MVTKVDVISIYINKLITAKQYVGPILPSGSVGDDLAGDADVVGRGLSCEE